MWAFFCFSWTINRGGQSCPLREAMIYRGLSAAADRFARRGKPKMPDTDKYSVVVQQVLEKLV